jgi:hypothetical protein
MLTSVPLFACETWKSTKKILKDLQTFINRCLRKTFKIFWLNTISNDELWSLAQDTLLEQQIKCRRGRPRMTWKKTVVRKPKKQAKHGRKLEH